MLDYLRDTVDFLLLPLIWKALHFPLFDSYFLFFELRIFYSIIIYKQKSTLISSLSVFFLLIVDSIFEFLILCFVCACALVGMSFLLGKIKQ